MSEINREESINARLDEWEAAGIEGDPEDLREKAELEHDTYVELYSKAYEAEFARLVEKWVAEGMDEDAARAEAEGHAAEFAKDEATQGLEEALEE